MVSRTALRPGRLRAQLALFGPAFVAAIAYVDPGNVATNTAAGAQYGYLLVWVVVAANLMAGVVQYLSAKLGLATGRSLPQAIGLSLGTPARITFWIQAELVAMATDLAEVIGGAIALQLLFGLPVLLGGLITGAISTLILSVQNRSRGQRRFEYLITAMLLVIIAGFLAGLFVAPPDAGAALTGLIPRFDGANSVLLAAGMLGATVMPHAVYLHSALARDRHGKQTGTRLPDMLRTTRYDIGTAMLLAGAVNLGMLLLAATALGGHSGVDTIEGAQAAIGSSLGGGIGILFALGLLASRLASTSVGCYAGAVVMDGLLRKRIPLLLRRAITLIPALAFLAFGADPTAALVGSQVALSFGLPFAVIPLVRLTARRSLMGAAANGRWTSALAWTITSVIVALNIALIYLTITQ